MKNFLIVLCIASIFGMANNTYACAGQEITSVYTKKKFCRSTLKMTWWAAHQWCESQSYEMAKPEDCNYTLDDVGYSWNDGSCGNLNVNGIKSETWFNLTRSDGKAVRNYLGFRIAWADRGDAWYALCRME